MWYIIPHTKTKIIAHVHTARGHTGTRADFFFGLYQLETRFARIIMIIITITLTIIITITVTLTVTKTPIPIPIPIPII